MKNNNKLNYICFELPQENSFIGDQMIFTFSVTQPNLISEKYNYYPPQLLGETYSRIIPKGSIAVFTGTQNDRLVKQYDYYLYQKKGITKMYIADCKNYPNCYYTYQDLDDLNKSDTLNRMNIWSSYGDKSSTMGIENYAIVAYCADDDNENNEYCSFETTIINSGKDIYLIENEKFSKFALLRERGKFVLDIQAGRQINSVIVDIMIYSGDVTFENSNEGVDLNYRKYYLANKVYFDYDFSQIKGDQIIIEYKAEINSFFTIQYNVSQYNSDKLNEKIYSGEHYLIQIDPLSSSKSKTIFLYNLLYKYQNPFFVNFYALNCDFEVKRGDESLDFFDSYAQEILDKGTNGYNSEYYEYKINIIESDSSNYNHKMCMMYISGYESESKYEREIIVGENINQMIIFNNIKKIRYLYPLADSGKDFSVHINIIDKAFFRVTVYAKNASIKEENITKTKTFYFSRNIISQVCESNRLCPIIVQVEYIKKIIKQYPMIEVKIREIKNTPTYFKKGEFKLDYVCADRYYYLYTDIGKNEMGYVTVNFLREYGKIFGKIVRKYTTEIEEEANWKGIYRLPSPDWEDGFMYDPFTKKFIVDPEYSIDCIEGCYLLLSIQISQIGEYIDDSVFYPFSITTQIGYSRSYLEIPIINIKLDEFIVGNVNLAENELISEFYEIWLEYDSEKVEFHFESSVAGLYINLNGIRPTTKNAHLILLPQGKDNIFTLDKNLILKIVKTHKIKIPFENSLESMHLVIGIWTDKVNSVNTEIYSLRVHQPSFAIDEPLAFNLVNRDQKILCNPRYTGENEYRCLFVVIYNENENDEYLHSNLLAYAESKNSTALTYIYGNYIEQEIYDQYNMVELNKKIPTYETSEFNSRINEVNYIYSVSAKKSHYMLLNVITDKPDTIMLLTSFPIYNYLSYDLFEIYPNPTSEQLFSLSGERLRLRFHSYNGIIVNLKSINGGGKLFWKNDPEKIYYLKGRGDKLILYSGEKENVLFIQRLEIEDKHELKNQSDGLEFIFIISYIQVDFKNNRIFEEIDYGKSQELGFIEADLPIILYSRIGLDYRDINIAITLKDIEIESSDELIEPIQITVYLVKEKTIYTAKYEPELSPSIEKAVFGNYDKALKTAFIFLDENIIKQSNLKVDDNPSLYIELAKSEIFKEKKFDIFSMEAQITGANSGVIPDENIYYYGRVSNKEREFNFYILKAYKNKGIMRIQIAFNSDFLDFVVADPVSKSKNVTFLHAEKKGGKISVTLKVNENKEFYYLYIFRKEKTDSELLNNYAFKYINVKDESELIDYEIFNSPELIIAQSQIDDNKDAIKCTFNKINIENTKVNITYFLKVFYKGTYLNGEEYNTIALTQSPYFSIFEKNPIPNNEGKITLTAKGNFSNWLYLNIMAVVQQNNNLEYISYNGIKNPIKIVIHEDNESFLREAIDNLNKNRGQIYINTTIINLKEKSFLELSGNLFGEIIGIKQENGQYPILNFRKQREMNYNLNGIVISGSNKLLKNIIIENCGASGIIVSGEKNTLDHIITRYNLGSGIEFYNTAYATTINYCYSYRNFGSNYGNNGNGFSFNGGFNIIFNYCFAWDNSDNGFSTNINNEINNIYNIAYYHSACWNNGNIEVFSGKYDYDNGNSLDKNLWTIQQIIDSDKDFENNYKNKKYNINNASINGENVKEYFSKANGYMNGNGFQFGNNGKNSGGRNIAENCIAFNHKSIGFDNYGNQKSIGLFTNCVSFNNDINYQLPFNFDKWENNWSWNAKSKEQNQMEQILKKPNNSNSYQKLISSINEIIANLVNENSFPDNIDFDLVINALVE